MIIVGAGLSGIAAAYHLQRACPNKRFVVLEARADIGGTWDLFRYPGIRSDSDMHTLGFSFYPWPDARAIADGPSIMAYLHETVERFDLGRHILFGHRVERAHWSSTEAQWRLDVRAPDGELVEFACRFAWACTGYYDYDHGYSPQFPGADSFTGDLIHPQHWPPDYDYSGKRVVVIGSGATAVTLVPAMAQHAAHVTMLQRSPTYVIALPNEDVIARVLEATLGRRMGGWLVRWKNILAMMGFYHAARSFPGVVARTLVALTRRQVGRAVDVDTHFTPRYAPWDQRVCAVPDGDLFDALRSGRASVVTAEIETFTPEGIRLKTGVELPADVIVTATGLNLQMLGGATVEVDGEVQHPGDGMLYRGAMLAGVPNAAISIGYTNASWTLKCELIAEYVCRLLRFMDDHGYSTCTPEPPADIAPAPLIDFTSGYVLRAAEQLPSQGSRAPWRLYQNYFLDQAVLRHRRIDDGHLRFA